ncbi:MAG: hypothetical protein AABY22_01330 [Nanoarchaeota archaeon]
MKNIKLSLVLRYLNDIEKLKSILPRKVYFAESVEDFQKSKEQVKRFNLFPENCAIIFFNDVVLEKYSDEIYDVSSEAKDSKPKFVRIYYIKDATGSELAVWPIEKSEPKIYLSCDEYERKKPFNGDMATVVSMLFNPYKDGKTIVGVDFYKNTENTRKTKGKKILERLVLNFE